MFKFITSILCVTQDKTQNYSFTLFAFILYDDDIRVESLYDADGFVLRFGLNYDYDSCEKMPCIIGTDIYKISEIELTPLNKILYSHLKKEDWNNYSKKIIKTEDELLNYILKHKIKIWDKDRLE